MDPLTAISLASNVVSFVQFASELVKSSREIYRSANGCAADVMSLDHVYGRLRSLSDDFAAEQPEEPTTHNVGSMEIRSLAALCKTDCDSLLEITRKLKSSSSSSSKWSSFRIALRTTWKQNAISELEKRLSNTQVTITLSICASMSKLYADHSKNLQALQRRNTQMQADQSAGLQSILTCLGELNAKLKSANGHLNRPFTLDEVREVERLFSQINLSERDVAKEQNIIKSLTFECLPFRYEAITEAHRQTFEWALDSKCQSLEAGDGKAQSCSLESWLRDGEDVFWVSGKPGSGKSTLMKFISEDTRTSKLLAHWASPKTAVVVSHYFWNGGTPMQRSLRGLLQTLLYEVFRKCPDVIPTACPDQWANSDSLSWTISALEKSLQKFVDRCVDLDSKFCFFIDGLDEHDGDHLELCKILNGFAKSVNIKICLSSRPWNVFDEAFGHGRPKLYVHELTRLDIRRYATSRLHQHPRWNLVITTPEHGKWLIDQITDRAWGVFLWATLVTKLLLNGLTNRDRFSDMVRRLDSFPTELEPFFRQILTSIEPFYSSKMATTLLIALAAGKPLHFLFYEFHDQEYDDRGYALKIPLQPLTKMGLKDTRERIDCHLDSRTRGLLELPTRGKTVTFLHRTVADFLNKEDIKRYLKTQVDPGLDYCAQLSLLKAELALAKAIERAVKVDRISFGHYQDYHENHVVEDYEHDDEDFDYDIIEDSIDVFETSDHNQATFHEITQSMLAHGAIVDVEDRPSWNEQLAQALDEMERVSAQLVIEDDEHVHAYFREQIVTSELFNYLRRKVFGDPCYVLNLGIELAMYLVRPCCYVPEEAMSKDGMVAVGRNADLFRKGLEVLRRAVEARCIDRTAKLKDHHGTAWSRLLSLLVSPFPQRRLLLSGLLEEDILSCLLQQGADRNADVISQTTGECEVAWAVFLSCAFDVPPVERIQAAYITTLRSFLGPEVELSSCSEPSAKRGLIFRHLLQPLQDSAGSGKPVAIDPSFMCSIASVLVLEAGGSACLVKDIQSVVREVLRPDIYDSLGALNPELISVSRRKRTWKETAISEEESGLRQESKSRKTAKGEILTGEP